MSRLAGKFAGVLLVKTSQNNQANLLRDLKELNNEGIKIIAELTNNLNHEPDERHLLNLVGNDRPGIIGELSSILAELNINVEELCTNCEDAPMSSELLFRASAVISFSGASKVSSALIQEELELLSDDLIIELELLEE
jgi:glycine cleavage system regulatory protein